MSGLPRQKKSQKVSARPSSCLNEVGGEGIMRGVTRMRKDGKNLRSVDRKSEATSMMGVSWANMLSRLTEETSSERVPEAMWRGVYTLANTNLSVLMYSISDFR